LDWVGLPQGGGMDRLECKDALFRKCCLFLAIWLFLWPVVCSTFKPKSNCKTRRHAPGSLSAAAQGGGDLPGG
ncbi:unnamed protein product, partial [Heterosigma akashiwo]